MLHENIKYTYFNVTFELSYLHFVSSKFIFLLLLLLAIILIKFCSCALEFWFAGLQIKMEKFCSFGMLSLRSYCVVAFSSLSGAWSRRSFFIGSFGVLVWWWFGREHESSHWEMSGLASSGGPALPFCHASKLLCSDIAVSSNCYRCFGDLS